MESIPDTEVQPGEILAGKFRIESILGRGGMGVVVSATHLQLDERVALKFLLPQALANPEAVTRFEREARAAVKIKSEHVARVTDVGTLETGAPYMVMEFLSGMDLGQYLEKTGPLPIDEAVLYLLQASEAIAEAHSMGIVHRDLKPANLFRIVRSDGTPSIKVLDFGISKVTSGTDASMTQTSSMMGSPYYMSPEQMTSAKNVDHRTDVWALGIILHELLSGKVPYDGETIPEVCAQVLQNPPPRLTELRSNIPEGLESAVEQALQKQRDDRYGDVAEFTAAIAPFGSDEGQRSVARISKVLGVAHPSSAKPGTNGTLPLTSNATSAQPQTPHSPTTLGGSARTQLDYSPSKKSSSWKPLALIAVVFLVGGGVWAALTDEVKAPINEEPLVVNEGTVQTDPTDLETAGEPSEPTSEPASPGSEQPSALTTQSSKTPPAPTQSSKTPPVSTNTPKPSPKAKPVSSPTPKATRKPSSRPTVPPRSRPAPKTKPNLYLDRK